MVFQNRIPLPQNNSHVAKQMRVAVVLGALARLITTFLFQPTYVLDEGSGLRQLLWNQARIDPSKETYTRGILLSMKHDDQDERNQEKVDFIVGDLEKVVGIDILLAAQDDLERFGEKLENHLVRFQKVWQYIQSGRQKLESSFDTYASATKHPWYIVELPAAEDSQKCPSTPRMANDAQDDMIIVPQILQIQTDGSPEPVTRGWVLQKCQTDAAHDEINRLSKAMRAVSLNQDAQIRPRDRPRRSMSISGNASQTLKKGGAFLRPGSAA